LLAQKAHAGSEKNKAAARQIDDLISIQNRSRHIEHRLLTCKSIFSLGVLNSGFVAAGSDRAGLVYEKRGVAEVNALGYSAAG
jgi:hypothetical protein